MIEWAVFGPIALILWTIALLAFGSVAFTLDEMWIRSERYKKREKNRKKK